MHQMTRCRILVLPLMAVVLALAATGCSDSGDGSGGTTTAATGGTAATSGCDEVNALKGSLTTLTGDRPGERRDRRVAVCRLGREDRPGRGRGGGGCRTPACGG